MQNSSFFRSLGLSSLSSAPMQVFGEIILIPLLRKDASSELGVFDVHKKNETPTYALFPHGLIVHSESRTEAQVVFGTQLMKWELLESLRAAKLSLRDAAQLGKRQRFLPLDLSTEGFLEYYFGGAPNAWESYASLVVSREITPAQEWAQSKEESSDIDDCVRSFEIHQEQTGVLIFIKGELALALVVPSHEDYRRLHASLLEDLCRGMFGFYGRFPSAMRPPSLPDDKQLNSLESLRAAVKRVKANWSTFHSVLGGGVLEVPLQFSAVSSIGPFRYKRFGSELLQTRENLLGEAIHRDSGRLEFLITYKLTRAETRRAYLVSCFSRADWEPRAAAASMNISLNEFNDRMRRTGLAYLLDQKVINEMRKLAKLNKKKK